MNINVTTKRPVISSPVRRYVNKSKEILAGATDNKGSLDNADVCHKKRRRRKKKITSGFQIVLMVKTTFHWLHSWALVDTCSEGGTHLMCQITPSQSPRIQSHLKMLGNENNTHHNGAMLFRPFTKKEMRRTAIKKWNTVSYSFNDAGTVE